jgi:hypothetical protein
MDSTKVEKNPKENKKMTYKPGIAKLGIFLANKYWIFKNKY